MNDRMPDRDDVIARLEGLLERAQKAEVFYEYNPLWDTEQRFVDEAVARDALTLLRETWRGMGELPADINGLAEILAYDPSRKFRQVDVRFAQDVWADPKCRWLPLPPLPKEEG